MRNLLKVLLPPFIGFAAYFVAIRYSSVYFTLRIDEMGEGTIESFMAYYRYFLPLLFTVAVLTQLLIVVPVWDRVFLNPARESLFPHLYFVLFVFCLPRVSVIASGTGNPAYVMWSKYVLL